MPATAVPAPAATAIPPVDAITVNNERATVRAAVDAWAAAWSRRDVVGYLRAYAPDFSPTNQQSLSDWTKERRARLSGRGSIKVTISDLHVAMDGNAATVTFTQVYQGAVRRRGRKALLMVKHGEKWLIQTESIVGGAEDRSKRGQDRVRAAVL